MDCGDQGCRMAMEHMVSCMQAKSHTYRLEFLAPLKTKQSILTADESCAEPKEYNEH